MFRELEGHHERQVRTVVPYASIDELPADIRKQLVQLPKAPRTKHNILVLYYGGTIGMSKGEDGRLYPDNNPQILETLQAKGLGEQMNVVWLPVFPGKAIDSTNARWTHWVSIGNAIRLLYDHFDGFVIVGGTDTMAHIMAAMNFMFPNLPKPIIGVGAQLPWFQLGEDGSRNLYFGLLAAASDLRGAHLAFDDKLMHGLRVSKVRDRQFDAFSCPSRYLIGEFDGRVNLFPDRSQRRYISTDCAEIYKIPAKWFEGERDWNSTKSWPLGGKPSPSQIEQLFFPNPLDWAHKLGLFYQPYFREGVKVVEISPATPSESLYHDGKDPMTAVLVVITFGAGNIRNESAYLGEMTHIDAIRRLTEEGVPVVLGSAMMDGRVDSPYACGASAVSESVGAISGGDLTGAALHVKAMFCLALAWDREKCRVGRNEFRRLMRMSFLGEWPIPLDPRINTGFIKGLRGIATLGAESYDGRTVSEVLNDYWSKERIVIRRDGRTVLAQLFEEE